MGILLIVHMDRFRGTLLFIFPVGTGLKYYTWGDRMEKSLVL
jgi:hypothetical protein